MATGLIYRGFGRIWRSLADIQYVKRYAESGVKFPKREYPTSTDDYQVHGRVLQIGDTFSGRVTAASGCPLLPPVGRNRVDNTKQ